MYNWLQFPILIAVFTNVKTEEFTFGPHQSILEMCIEDYLLKAPNPSIRETSKDIARIVSKRFNFRSYSTLQFYKATNKIFYTLRDGHSDLFSDNKVPQQLRLLIKDALKDCVERHNLPRFHNEPLVLGDLLDFILVDWPTSAREMILTQNGRSTLRLYAYSVGVRLMAALGNFSMDFDAFHRELQRIWTYRAEQYYDGIGAVVSYMRHRFTTDHDRTYSSVPLEDVHTIDDVDSFSFVWRRTQNFSQRNPVLDQWNTIQILNILGVGNDGYPESNITLFTGADYYLKIHIVRCYRIILFVLEMQMRGINTDEDDVYNGMIPYNVMPLPLQDLAWSNPAFRNYITLWREHLQQFTSEELEECYSREDLIMLLSMLIVQKTSSVTSSSTTTSTTTTSTTTECPDYGNGSKKGGIRAPDCKKYFLPKKRFRLMFPEQDQEFKQMDTNCRSYGYIEHAGELNQLILLERNHSTLPDILKKEF